MIDLKLLNVSELTKLLEDRENAAFYEACENPTTEEHLLHNKSIIDGINEVRDEIKSR